MLKRGWFIGAALCVAVAAGVALAIPGSGGRFKLTIDVTAKIEDVGTDKRRWTGTDIDMGFLSDRYVFYGTFGLTKSAVPAPDGITSTIDSGTPAWLPIFGFNGSSTVGSLKGDETAWAPSLGAGEMFTNRLLPTFTPTGTRRNKALVGGAIDVLSATSTGTVKIDAKKFERYTLLAKLVEDGFITDGPNVGKAVRVTTTIRGKGDRTR